MWGGDLNLEIVDELTRELHTCVSYSNILLKMVKKEKNLMG